MIENLVFVFVFSFFGLLVSARIYALQNSKKTTCQKAYHSKYASLGNFRSASLGILFYLGFLIQAFHALQVQNISLLMQIQAVIGIVVSAYFAYILFVKLKTFCLFCVLTYVANIAIFFLIFF